MSKSKSLIAVGWMLSLNFIGGCGGGAEHGVFLDSPVEGLQFRTESLHGVTDA